METELPEGYHPTIDEFQREWIETLESGKFKQGKELLRSKNDSYCCLGVACVLFKDRFDIKEEQNEYGDWTYNGLDGTASKVLQDVLSLYGALGEASIKDDLPALASLNDSGKTFAEIAAELKTGKYFKNCNV